MAKIILEDDCFAPNRTLRIDFKGPRPFRFYSELILILRDIWEIRTMHIWERDFRWDNSVNPNTFFYKVVIQKKYDAWTTAYCEYIFQGNQPTDPKKDGDMTILITPKLRTEMPDKTVWQRSAIYKGLRWLYFRTFYDDARRILLGKCIHQADGTIERLKSVLGILPPQRMEA